MKNSERVAFSPGEFATLFGKSQTWGYRQIYSGKVTTITEYGRILIPASEVERIIGKAAPYNGIEKKPARSKEEIEALMPKLPSIWQEYLEKRRLAKKGKIKSAPKAGVKKTQFGESSREAAYRRLTKNGDQIIRQPVQ